MSFEKVFVITALVLYTTSGFYYFRGVNDESMHRAAFLTALAGFVANFFVLVYRTIANQRVPFTNGYEFLLCFTCVTVLIYLVCNLANWIKNVGGPVMLISGLLLLALLVLMPDQFGTSTQLTPALKSPWLAFHVFTAVVAYGAFAVAAGIAVVQLKRLDTINLDYATYRVVSGGFAMLSLSIVLGAVWAEQAWGSYWSWDPKETWALITWLVYAIYLHIYRQRGWRGKKAGILVIVGFIIVLFTFFGVNYLMGGLHSYAST